MTRHASTQIPAMQCTQRLDPILLDELIVETRSIEELDLDRARISPLEISFHAKPPQRIDLQDIEIVDDAPVIDDRPLRALSAAPGGTVSRVSRRWWIASGGIVAGGLVWAAIWLAF